MGALSATVSHVDRVLDAASNSFRVRLSLPNPGYALPAGLRCKADLPVQAAADKAVPKLAPVADRSPPAPAPARARGLL